MYTDFEATLQKEIRKRAFVRRDRLQHEKQRSQNIQHTLAALHDVTELSRSELRAIARDAQLACACLDENFFSIRNQILVACAIFGFVIILGWLLINA
jgi:hypothetical protein